jgi:hypothetical protein
VANKSPRFGRDVVKQFLPIDRIYFVLEVVPESLMYFVLVVVPGSHTHNMHPDKKKHANRVLSPSPFPFLLPTRCPGTPKPRARTCTNLTGIRVEMVEVLLVFPPPAFDVKTQIMSQVVLEHLRHVCCLLKVFPCRARKRQREPQSLRDADPDNGTEPYQPDFFD